MFGLGFQGQFGGGFLQAPDGAIHAGAGGGGVVYSTTTHKPKPKDDSQRKQAYQQSAFLSFPVSTGQEEPHEGFLTSPVFFHPGAVQRGHRYR